MKATPALTFYQIPDDELEVGEIRLVHEIGSKNVFLVIEVEVVGESPIREARTLGMFWELELAMFFGGAYEAAKGKVVA